MGLNFSEYVFKSFLDSDGFCWFLWRCTGTCNRRTAIQQAQPFPRIYGLPSTIRVQNVLGSVGEVHNFGSSQHAASVKSLLLKVDTTPDSQQSIRCITSHIQLNGFEMLWTLYIHLTNVTLHPLCKSNSTCSRSNYWDRKDQRTWV